MSQYVPEKEWSDYHSSDLFAMSKKKRIALHAKSYRGQMMGVCISCKRGTPDVHKFWDGLCMMCGYCVKCHHWKTDIGLCQPDNQDDYHEDWCGDCTKKIDRGTTQK